MVALSAAATQIKRARAEQRGRTTSERSSLESKDATMQQDRANAAVGPSVGQVLVVDVGGSAVKVLVTGQTEARKFRSGPTLTPRQMVSGVKKLAADWKYDVVSIGYPGPVLAGRPIAEPPTWDGAGLASTSLGLSAVR